jgi:gamma-glutamyl:cysteine ligase YbdK (ATP-grasp superfamily)
MGQPIATSHFTPHDFRLFGRRLRDETRILARWFRDGRFPDLPWMAGMEVEAWLVYDDLTPAPLNRAFIERLGDPLVVPELAKFNFELNTEPRLLQGDALSRMEAELKATWDRCRRTAADMGGGAVLIGILPTVAEHQLCVENMSQQERYRALNEQIFRQRQGRPMQLDIVGRDALHRIHTDVMLESATTSFQIHLRVRPGAACRLYNAALIASAPMVAVSANSPFLFGCDLWDETRIPLFEQSVASPARSECAAMGGRVTFGQSYVQDSLMECFEENQRCFEALLPLEMDKYPASLSHLRLHNGTIWRWNRPLIGFEEDGEPHLRIEHRTCPAGPSILDSMANAAFFFGLACGLGERTPPPEADMDFDRARTNFYRAAQDGLAAEITWLDGARVEVRDLIVDELLPLAKRMLVTLGLEPGDVARYLEVIRRRTESGTTGAAWQRAWVARHGNDMAGLMQAYINGQVSGRPVHTWDV